MTTLHVPSLPSLFSVIYLDKHTYILVNQQYAFWYTGFWYTN